MNKILTRVLALTLCFVLIVPFMGSADEIKPWYMDYTTEYGTKLTRDWNFELGDELKPVYSMEMKDNFFTFRDELPDEIPVWAPYTDEEIAKSKNKLYISPDGNDDNPGTIDKPLKTLEKASELAKTNRKGGLTIYLREGTYSNTAGHVVNHNANGTAQKPTFVSAYPGEDVTLTSAISVKGSQMKIADDEVANRKLNSNVKGKVYSVNLKELGYTQFGTFAQNNRPSLYVDGNQYTIARWPNADNTGMVRYAGTDGEYGVIDSGDVRTAAGKTGEYRIKGNGFEFVMSSSRPLSWENTGNIWMYGYWYEEWDKLHVKVRHFDEKRNSVRSVQSDPYGILHQNHNSYYFYNILEELDSPGEWFVDDKTGMLYVYPSASIENSDVMITIAANSGIKADNTQYVIFNDLDINTAGNYGIQTERSRYTIFQNCTVRNTANHGVKIKGYHTGILNCDIDSSCYLTSPTEAQNDGTAGYITWVPTCNFVQNSIVQGMLQPSWGMHDVISHNLVTGSTAQSLYAHREFEAIFEYNEVVAGPNQTLDSGLIYFGCTAIHRGNHARYNYLNRATPVIRSGIAYGIYFDDMSSQNYAYGNIVREAGLFFHGGSNNVAYNNIFIDKDNGSTNSAANSNNYVLTAERWSGMIISDTDTRWSRQSRSTYQGHWMNRYVNDYELITNLLYHKHDYESSTYDIAKDDFGVYVTRPKDNYYANNLFVNSPGFLTTVKEERAVYEDNIVLDYIPDFEDYEDGLFDLTEEEIKSINPNMEVLPTQHKMGLIYDPAFKREKMSLATPETLSPLNTTETPIYENEGVTLSWSKVFGFSYYDVEVATDPEFENIIFEKTVQVPSVVVPALELDTTYYWRVTVGTWTHEFDMTPKTSETAVFRIGTEQEILENTVIELASVNSQIGFLEDRIPQITEDYNKDLEKAEADRIYTGDPTDELTKLVASFQERKHTDIKFKKDVDLFTKTIQSEFIGKWGEYVKPHTVYVNDYLPTVDSFRTVGKAKEIVATDYGYDFEVSSGVAMYASKDAVLIRPNATYKTRMKFETIGPWNCLNLMQSGNGAGNPTQTSSYFVAFKSDIIELQRYPKDDSWKNGIVQQFENNKTVVKDDTWFDVEYKFEYLEEGIHVTVSIDGKEYFNYLDTLNLNYFYDNLGYMANQVNGVMSVANPE